MSLPPTTIPPGSWILITGLTGFIASHTALALLSRGFKVRGTVRSLSSASWLLDSLFPSYAASGAFELVSVPDMAAPHAFDAAMKGMSAVAHIAAVSSLAPNPHEVIPVTVAGTRNVLEAARKESGVKRFVLTSSAVAVGFVRRGEQFVLDSRDWNEEAGERAWAPPPFEVERGAVVYMASKVESERAVWEFVREEKPHFSVNTVTPFTAFGRILNSHQSGSTASWIQMLYRGETELLKANPFSDILPLVYVSVTDIAHLHVAALLDTTVENERLHAWAMPVNWDDILSVMRKLRPEREFATDLPQLGRVIGTVEQSLSLKLLKKWVGQDEWTSLEQGIRENIEGLD